MRKYSPGDQVILRINDVSFETGTPHVASSRDENLLIIATSRSHYKALLRVMPLKGDSRDRFVLCNVLRYRLDNWDDGDSLIHETLAVFRAR